ncbi:MAG: DUF559 domain-containing protein [Candidatus Stahlbacteria bacterium]|nr:DUF559 domain-containing protein [bacterium]TET22169.1 MAG: DUF559 domain-containing protein [Candidatus Stahlbacteria bacterium]
MKIDRERQTTTEAKIWTCLRNRRLLGAKFKRQHPIGRYIVDFYCHGAKLVVEIDGGGHNRVRVAQALQPVLQYLLGSPRGHGA